jgi:predicted nucleic acid-binding protein
MKKSSEHTRKFLFDTNVFVSALKMPGKALELFIELLSKKYDVVGNVHLLDEYVRYSKEMPSDVARFLLAGLSAKMRVVNVAPRFVKICRPYFPPRETVDVVLAATCLQEGAVLITNDRHFDRIKKDEVIEVWSISDAIKRLLEPSVVP